MAASRKNWDRHVVHAEHVARTDGFRAMRDKILARAAPQAGEVAVDVGAGTGLLTLVLAERASRVWAIDIAPSMCEYLRAKAASAGLGNVDVVVASAESLPLVDGSADIVVSNYCFHHLDDEGKRHALREARRVLRPGGRLVFGDMMFGVGLLTPRDRMIVASKIRALVAKGPAGVVRLASNGLRLAAGRWERPISTTWWERALREAGFVDVDVRPLAHEGGIGAARRP